MTNAPTKKFRATVDDASFEVEVAGDIVRIDVVSGQPRSNDQPSQAYTPPSSKQQRTEQGGVTTLAGLQFAVSARGQAIDVTHASTDGSSNTPAARAFVATVGDVTWVSIDGEVFTIDIEDAQRTVRRPRAAAGEGLSAPMPATVIKVLAEPGREVKRGETLLLLEAMKMELPVRAPRDGKVKALHCQAGELVQPGVPLVDLE